MKKMSIEKKREIIRRMNAEALVAQFTHTFIRCDIDEADTEESRNLLREELVRRLEAKAN